MGLFDSFKKIASDAANNAIDDALTQMKRETKEAVQEEAKERTQEALKNGVNSYLDNASKNVTTEDGREAINTLQDMVKTTEAAYSDATSVESSGVDYTAEAAQELAKLSEIAENYNNSTDNQKIDTEKTNN